MNTAEPSPREAPVSRRPRRVWLPLASIGLMLVLLVGLWAAPWDGLKRGTKLTMLGRDRGNLRARVGDLVSGACGLVIGGPRERRRDCRRRDRATHVDDPAVRVFRQDGADIRVSLVDRPRRSA